MLGLELAFAFSAAEFLEEEIEELEEKYGRLAFIANGKYFNNKEAQHSHEWWAKQEDIDELNQLINKNKESKEMANQIKTEYFFHTQENPRTTVGGLYDPNDGVIRLAKATCGPNDQFVKKVGRHITIGRIKANKHIDLVEVDDNEHIGTTFVKAALRMLGKEQAQEVVVL